MFRISSRLRSSSWRIATPTSSSRSCALRQAASRIPRASRRALRSYGAASRSTTPVRSRAVCARCRASSEISPTPSTRTIARRRPVFSRRRHRPAALCPPLGFPRPTSSSRFAFPCPIERAWSRKSRRSRAPLAVISNRLKSITSPRIAPCSRSF